MKRGTGIGVGLVIAVGIDARDHGGGDGDIVPVFTEEESEGDSGPLESFTIGDRAIDDFREEILHEGDTAAGVFFGAFTEIEEIGPGVVLNEEVLIGAEVETGFGSASGDLGEAGGFVTADAGIAVLDSPVVVGADGGGEVVTLFHARGGDIDREVIHDAGGGGFRGAGGIFDFSEGFPGAGLEVVTKAEGVSDFVHDNFLESLTDELFGKFTTGVDFPPVGEDRGGKAELGVHLLTNLTVAAGKETFTGMEVGGDEGGRDRLVILVSGSGSAGGGSGEIEDGLHRIGSGSTEVFVLGFPKVEESGIEDDVGVEDFSGEGIDTRGAHGEAGVGLNPAEEVVTAIFGIDVTGILTDFDGVGDAEFLEGLVPLLDPRLNDGSITDGDGVFDVEDDGLFGRGEAD